MKECMRMQIQLRIFPSSPICSLDLVPFIILIYSRSLKHHHSWRWHLGKRMSWNLTKFKVPNHLRTSLIIHLEKSFLATNKCMAKSLSTSKQIPSRKLSFLEQTRRKLYNLSLCTSKEYQEQASHKIILSKFIQRRLTKAALYYNQVLKLTYTYTHKLIMLNIVTGAR